MKIKARNVVFDMDDTFTQTSEYIRELLFARWEKEKREDLVDLYNRHTKTQGQINITYPDIRQHIYEILGDPTFMLNVKPTRLFTRLFKTKELYGLIHKKNVIIATHRGFHDLGEEYTNMWLSQQRVGKYIKKVHCLKSSEHPNKIDFLKSHYNDDFVLIDDNPFHDLTQEYQENSHVIIYNEYGNYPAYRNQNFLIF